MPKTNFLKRTQSSTQTSSKLLGELMGNATKLSATAIKTTPPHLWPLSKRNTLNFFLQSNNSIFVILEESHVSVNKTTSALQEPIIESSSSRFGNKLLIFVKRKETEFAVVGAEPLPLAQPYSAGCGRTVTSRVNC